MKVAPETADEHRQQVEVLAKNASQRQLAQVRNSGAYRNAQRAVQEFVAKIDQHNVRRVCSKSGTHAK
jgi:hypothetical protein